MRALLERESPAHSSRLFAAPSGSYLCVGLRRLSTQNERLTAVLTEVHKEQERMTEAKTTVMQALGLGNALNITDILAHNKAL